jgi:hypothetical protein
MAECLDIDLALKDKRLLMAKFEKNGWMDYNKALEVLEYRTDLAGDHT